MRWPSLPLGAQPRAMAGDENKISVNRISTLGKWENMGSLGGADKISSQGLAGSVPPS